MGDLQINWNQEKPTGRQLNVLWDDISIESIGTWTKSAEVLKSKIKETHSNGGLQLHKYKLKINDHFAWYSTRNRLDEIDFVNNFLKRPELASYRKDLEISLPMPDIKTTTIATDIYDLVGQLARMLGHGGAYKKLDPITSWTTASDFVREELQNRFEDFVTYGFVVENADWFYDIAWDSSTLLFDKRNNQVIIIDITDTD